MLEGRWQSRRAVLVDLLTAIGACLFAVLLRYDLSASRILVGGTLLLACAYGATLVVSGSAVGLYMGRWKLASFDELRHLAIANAIAFLAFVTAEAVFPALRTHVPLGAVFICAGFSLMSQGALRYVWRARDEWQRERASAGGRAVIVAGAGEGGEQIVRALRGHPENGRRPVALLDDDPLKRNLELLGVKVLGRLDHLERVASATGAEELLIAMPSADAELVSRLAGKAEQLGLSVTVLPSSLELGARRNGSVGVKDIRKVSIVDFLGREPIDRQLTEIATYLLGKRVLVTGAGGSIGSELCRQLQRLNPRQLLLLDHDETNLHDLQLELRNRAVLDLPELIIGDVRDAARLEAVFDTYRPEVVFHVAAHKHLPLLEMHPCEAVKTNVLGTINVARAAGRAGCSHVINVSTDKAAEPTSVLGATKRAAELYCQRVRREFPVTVFTSVRFGNVLGSRGSIIPVFERQIAQGGPLTVTHPEATRYFMTIAEAAQLVIHAGALAKGGEIFVLDMGEPVRILDVAQKMIELAGANDAVRISYTGLRPGEKLHERLFFEHEHERSHERVEERMWLCHPGDLPDGFDHDLAVVNEAATAEDTDSVLDALSRLVPGYHPTCDTPYLGAIYPDGL